MIGIGANADEVGMRVLRKFKLTQTEHDVLACARRQGAPHIVTPSLLLEEVRITSGALTTCLNRLTARALVTRPSNTRDLRVKPVQLTSEGLELIEQITQLRFKMAGEVLAHFSPQKKQQLKQLLLDFNEGLKNVNPD
ncbi:MarR family transcriptional regulator [Alteromonas gilva]|uniref:MarR family transcriptional regulator n=1 Tax=Alteromonas gilva TaxID=2987522 RepID=A0ABT5L4L8_9ALTE|nr:MarR family transcriptional regulator [Alteromonas gilva]MDC8831994.1 MarR family transcriptional regulator [Alteromonas gilva]